MSGAAANSMSTIPSTSTIQCGRSSGRLYQTAKGPSLKSKVVWSPTTKIRLCSGAVSVSATAYLNAAEEYSYVSEACLSQLGIMPKWRRLTDTKKLTRGVHLTIQTLDGFCESQKHWFILKKSRKGRNLILGRNFLNANDMEMDYVGRTCRWGILSYDVLTQQPMPCRQSSAKSDEHVKHQETETPMSLFIQELNEYMYYTRQNVDRLCEPTIANIRRRFPEMTASRIKKKSLIKKC